MKVLVIHDRDEITEKITTLLAELNVEIDNIYLAEDGVTARDALGKQRFDLVILDLTIPHMKQRSSPDYGVVEELLVEVFESSSLNAPGDLIGITRDPSALENIDSKIGPHLMAIVEEDDKGVWVDRLRDRIQYVIKSFNSRLQSINQHFDYDVAIITALDKEYLPYKELFEFSSVSHYTGAQSFIFNDRDDRMRRGIAYSIGKAGQASAASATQAIITQFRPALCIMSGFCGGFASKTKTGDVIFAESVVDWDSGKWLGTGEEAKFVPRPEPINIRDTKVHRAVRDMIQVQMSRHIDVLARVAHFSQNRISQISFQLGPMASGSAVVTDPIIINRIQDLNENILGVDMEAFGFCYAASTTPVIKPEFLVVKAVADFCDAHKAEKDQAACSYLSANVVQELISRRWSFA